MAFLWPWMLVSLLLVPASALLYARAQQRRERRAASLGALGVVRDRAANPLGRRRHLPAILYLTGLTLLALAMARPEMVVSLPRIEGTVILAFDVSASMGAEDMQPNRMEAAKAAAQAFIAGQPDQILIGVVAFSDSGLEVQAPTSDRQALAEAIDRFIPQSGTSLGQGILMALNAALEDQDPDPDSTAQTPPLPPAEGAVTHGALSPAVIVLLSDGENTDQLDPLEAAQAAIERGVRIYTVGIGSPEGAVLEIEGFNVFSQLDEDLLKRIARVAEGEYYHAADESDLHQIYEDLDLEFVVKPEKMEITALIAGLSFLALLAGGILALVWFGRLP